MKKKRTILQLALPLYFMLTTHVYKVVVRSAADIQLQIGEILALANFSSYWYPISKNLYAANGTRNNIQVFKLITV